MDSTIVLILLGAALAMLGGAWTAAALWIITTLPRGVPGQQRNRRETPEDPAHQEEALRSAAMQEGFDNLMRYSVGSSAGEGEDYELRTGRL